jgi:hypothetical protein
MFASLLWWREVSLDSPQAAHQAALKLKSGGYGVRTVIPRCLNSYSACLSEPLT